MFVLARIQIFREIPLKVKSAYDHLNTQKFHTFVYERKSFALQCNFSELCVTNSAQIPIFTMGQMSENKYASSGWIFRLLKE